MMLGHAAGVAAALTAKAGASAAVQDVDPAAVAAALRADGAILEPRAAPPAAASYGCQAGGGGEKRCLLYAAGARKGNDTTCGGECPALADREWLALKGHYFPPSPSAPHVLRSRHSTVPKKSERISGELPPWAKQAVGPVGGAAGVELRLSRPAAAFDGAYYLVACAAANCSAGFV